MARLSGRARRSDKLRWLLSRREYDHDPSHWQPGARADGELPVASVAAKLRSYGLSKLDLKQFRAALAPYSPSPSIEARGGGRRGLLPEPGRWRLCQCASLSDRD